MNSDESVIASLPVGYRANLIMISLAKRWLTRDDITVAERLRTLESIDQMAFGAITPKVAAEIEPANAAFEEAFTEAMHMATGDEQCPRAFALLERDEAFLVLCRINPSLIRAIKLCHRRSRPARDP